MTLVTLALVSCTRGRPPATDGNGMAIRPWAERPGYYAWNGVEPTLLAGVGANLFLRDDAQQLIKEIAAAGGNLITVVLRPGEGRPQPFLRDEVSGQYDLRAPNVEYWEGFKELLRTARSYNVVVHLHGFGGEHYIPSPDQAFEQVFNRKVLSTIAPFRDIIITGTSPYERSRYRLDTMDFPSLRTASARFNALALTGEPIVEYRAQPGFPYKFEEALSAIRALRNVERTFNFWDLTIGNDINQSGLSSSVIAARDGLDNYAIYLDGPRAVQVRLDTRRQIRRRVSVIGYLGTRRSEVLKPPYGSVFELSTEDERGAWLLVKALE